MLVRRHHVVHQSRKCTAGHGEDPYMTIVVSFCEEIGEEGKGWAKSSKRSIKLGYCVSQDPFCMSPFLSCKVQNCRCCSCVLSVSRVSVTDDASGEDAWDPPCLSPARDQAW